jgi:hypothetical protein
VSNYNDVQRRNQHDRIKETPGLHQASKKIPQVPWQRGSQRYHEHRKRRKKAVVPHYLSASFMLIFISHSKWQYLQKLDTQREAGEEEDEYQSTKKIERVEGAI